MNTRPRTHVIVFAAVIAFLCGLAVMYAVPKYVAPSVGQTGVAENGDLVSIAYVGKLSDGTVFDSTESQGHSFQFNVGRGMVRKGLDAGVVGMRVGESKTFNVSAPDGYGVLGVPDDKGGYLIPPNAELTYDVQLLGLKKAVK